MSRPAMVEWYVARQFGANVADQLSDIRGTGALNEFRAPDFDLQNSFVYGGKVGMFPGNGWCGVELDVFHDTPHIRNLDEGAGSSYAADECRREAARAILFPGSGSQTSH